eukprot:scaffold157921_cov21-Tisochrysis_lutea.AAC.1
MPMPNFVPSERSKRATLGPRKISVDMLKQLLGKSCTVITMDRSGPEEVEEVEVGVKPLWDISLSWAHASEGGGEQSSEHSSFMLSRSS